MGVTGSSLSLSRGRSSSCSADHHEPRERSTSTIASSSKRFFTASGRLTRSLSARKTNLPDSSETQEYLSDSMTYIPIDDPVTKTQQARTDDRKALDNERRRHLKELCDDIAYLDKRHFIEKRARAKSESSTKRRPEPEPSSTTSSTRRTRASTSITIDPGATSEMSMETNRSRVLQMLSKCQCSKCRSKIQKLLMDYSDRLEGSNPILLETTSTSKAQRAILVRRRAIPMRAPPSRSSRAGSRSIVEKAGSSTNVQNTTSSKPRAPSVNLNKKERIQTKTALFWTSLPRR